MLERFARHASLLALVASVFTLSGTRAQIPGWVQRTPATSPSARVYSAMAYDSAHGRAVLFGGQDPNPAILGDTWEWDGTAWLRRTPPASPSPRCFHAMAYDVARGRVVLFGGTPIGAYSETWEWDGINWTLRNPATFPSARSGHMMVYDSRRSRVVLFGGAYLAYFSDTWEWDGVNWLLRNPATKPPGRLFPSMAYDSARGRAVLFGGTTSTGQLADTWEWDGINWIQRSPAASPSLRSAHAMAYDVARQRVVLFGGEGGPNVFADTWEWDGVTWVQRTPGPSPAARHDHVVAYDSARGRVVLFGGFGGAGGNGWLGDTWEYLPPIAATFSAYGTGCAGTVGAPVLASLGTSLPWLASTFSVDVANIPSSIVSIPFLMIGASRTSWGTYPLPLDLGFVGMPGCALLTSLDVTLTLSNLGGYARADLAIPNDLGLLGRAFFAQSIVLDRPANAMGATVSNAGEAKIGAR